MAISIYRRHRKKCKYRASPTNKIGCKCGFWGRGTLEGKVFRKSLKTKNWERAEEIKRELEGPKTHTKGISLREAIARYTTDCAARGLSPATRKKTTGILAALQTFSGEITLEHLSLSDLDRFRATWTTWSAVVQSKQIERLRAFFRFCVERRLIAESPAQYLKAPKVDPPTVDPFTEDELEKIHETIKHPIMRAFVLTLQHTGLRISDAVQLKKDDIVNGKLCIVTQKKKVIVWLPLPPTLLAALEKLKTTQYYFWTGQSKLTTVIGSKRRGISKLMTRAKVCGNPHKFRHTLATSLLTNGTPVALVAKILGNSPKVVEKYYDHWIQARQNQLEVEIQKTWPETKLALVKK